MSTTATPDVGAFLQCLLEGNRDRAVAAAQAARADGMTPVEFITAYVDPALEEVGRRFERLDIFLPEMVTAADAVQEVLKQVIYPGLEGSVDPRAASAGKVVVATIRGDLHDIGKDIVAMMLRVSGFEVFDLGTDVSPFAIVETAEREAAYLILISSLLTSCLPYMKDVVDLLKEKGCRRKHAVVIGGAAATPEYSIQIGADAQGHSAAEAVEICKALLAERRETRGG